MTAQVKSKMDAEDEVMIAVNKKVRLFLCQMFTKAPEISFVDTHSLEA